MNRDQIRDQLVEALPHEWYCAMWMAQGDPCHCAQREATADALAPLVEQLCRDAAADALHDMADRLTSSLDRDPARRIRGRAIAIRMGDAP